MATTQTRAPRKRLGLTKVQRRQIRRWRNELGIEMWTVNDDLYDMKLKFRERALVPAVAETIRAGKYVEMLLKKVLAVRKGLVNFLKKKEKN